MCYSLPEIIRDREVKKKKEVRLKKSAHTVLTARQKFSSSFSTSHGGLLLWLYTPPEADQFVSRSSPRSTQSTKRHQRTLEVLGVQSDILCALAIVEMPIFRIDHVIFRWRISIFIFCIFFSTIVIADNNNNDLFISGYFGP